MGPAAESAQMASATHACSAALGAAPSKVLSDATHLHAVFHQLCLIRVRLLRCKHRTAAVGSANEDKSAAAVQPRREHTAAHQHKASCTHATAVRAHSSWSGLGGRGNRMVASSCTNQEWCTQRAPLGRASAASIHASNRSSLLSLTSCMETEKKTQAPKSARGRSKCGL